MTRQDYLKQSLESWKHACLQGDIQNLEIGDHIGDDTFYELAIPGGMDQAAPEDLEHISSCPVCLEKWAGWRRAVSDATSAPPEEEHILTYGMLQAAAGKEPQEAVNIKSSCGRFRLGIYPDRDAPTKAMIVLEFIAGDAIEGKTFVVRDRKGTPLIAGSMKQGRLARICENTHDLDLSGWSLVEKV